MLASDKATAANTGNGDTAARTGPILIPVIERDVGTGNTAQTEDKELDTLGGHDVKTVRQSGVAVGNNVSGSSEDDWVNLTLSPNHPLISNKHPLESSGGD